jgi:hypothetical protein
MSISSGSPSVDAWALVQIAGAGKRPALYCRDFKLGARHSTLQAPVDLGHTQTSQSELSLADAMHQFDTGDRNRRGREALEAQHRGDSLFHAPMVLLDQIVQGPRRPQLRLGGQQAIGFQLTHRAVRRGIAVQRDRPGSSGGWRWPTCSRETRERRNRIGPLRFPRRAALLEQRAINLVVAA